MRTPRNQLHATRSGSAWSETRSGRFLCRAIPVPGLAATDILCIKARLVQDSRRLPSLRRRALRMAAVVIGLVAAAFLAGRLF